MVNSHWLTRQSRGSGHGVAVERYRSGFCIRRKQSDFRRSRTTASIVKEDRVGSIGRENIIAVSKRCGSIGPIGRIKDLTVYVIAARIQIYISGLQSPYDEKLVTLRPISCPVVPVKVYSKF